MWLLRLLPLNKDKHIHITVVYVLCTGKHTAMVICMQFRLCTKNAEFERSDTFSLYNYL